MVKKPFTGEKVFGETYVQFLHDMYVVYIQSSHPTPCSGDLWNSQPTHRTLPSFRSCGVRSPLTEPCVGQGRSVHCPVWKLPGATGATATSATGVLPPDPPVAGEGDSPFTGDSLFVSHGFVSLTVSKCELVVECIESVYGAYLFFYINNAR